MGIRRIGAMVFAVTLAGIAPAATAHAQDASGDRGAEVAVTLLGKVEEATYATSPPGPDYRGTTFVAEKQGRIKIIRNGQVLARPFLDIRSRILMGAERGLLSFAFHPRFSRNGRVFVYFTDREGDLRIVSYLVSPARPLEAAQRSAVNVLEIPHRDFPGHNGGTIAFGPDDKLWLATGDGGGDCDPNEMAQNPLSLLGKLLRISPLPGGGYAIPADNPFVGIPGYREEVYSLGFRNPFRFSFDEPTGTIAIGDVGQTTTEEIDIETLADTRGANFGWDAQEGSAPLDLEASICFADEATPVPDDSVPPVFEFPHEERSCAVTGGLIVRDRRLDSLLGRYLFTDLCDKQLRSIAIDDDGGADERLTGAEIVGPTSIVAGRRDRIFATSITGEVYRLDPTG